MKTPVANMPISKGTARGGTAWCRDSAGGGGGGRTAAGTCCARAQATAGCHLRWPPRQFEVLHAPSLGHCGLEHWPASLGDHCNKHGRSEVSTHRAAPVCRAILGGQITGAGGATCRQQAAGRSRKTPTIGVRLFG